MARPAKYAFKLLLTEKTIEIPLEKEKDHGKVRSAASMWAKYYKLKLVTHMRGKGTDDPYLEITVVGDRVPNQD